MDSQSQPPSFIDLLNSQLSPNKNTTQFMSSSSLPNIGGNVATAPSVGKRTNRCKWSSTEDIVLISGWLNTSKDPLVGNEQKADKFWKRIATYYGASPKVVGFPNREAGQCKQRWGKINEAVCKFVGCYEAATKQKTSGQNEDDVLKNAHDIYFNDYQVKFSIEHAWRELRYDQKWCSTYGASSGSSKRKRDDQSVQSSATMRSINGEEESMTRPMGVKAAKAKTKKSWGAEKDLGEFQSVWEIKQKDFAMKEKAFAVKDMLSNKKLLDSLISKSEPLTQVEVALKDKLISELFSM